MQQRHAYRSLLFIIMAIWSVFPGGTAEREPISGLVEAVCEQGQTAKSPTLAKQFGFDALLRIVEEKRFSRTLSVPAKQCGGDQHADTGSYSLVISYALDVNMYPRVVHWYQTSSKGELVRSFRSVVESREKSNINWFSITPTNEMRAEFESEKRYWLAKYGLPAQ